MLLFFNDSATNQIDTYLHTLSLHYALPIFPRAHPCWINIDQRQLHVKIEVIRVLFDGYQMETRLKNMFLSAYTYNTKSIVLQVASSAPLGLPRDRKSTRLNSSH